MKLLSSSGNLLKRNWVQLQQEEKRMIDSNVLLEKRLRGYGRQEALSVQQGREMAAPAGFQGGLNAEELNGILKDSDGEENSSALIKAEEPIVPPQPVYEGPSPEELIVQAEEEIRQMKAAAQAELDAAKTQAVQSGREEGRKQGYQEGTSSAQAELDIAKRKLEDAYQEKLREMEPEIVKQLTGIYEYIFHVELGNYQNLVMQLLDGCMQKIENSGSYIVHVGPEDYPFVSMQKKALAEEMGNKNASLEIVEDATMKKNSCMIETEGGIYDCGLDIQLAALGRQLRLLSYTPEG